MSWWQPAQAGSARWRSMRARIESFSVVLSGSVGTSGGGCC
jgi:hypothetical protein